MQTNQYCNRDVVYYDGFIGVIQVIGVKRFFLPVNKKGEMCDSRRLYKRDHVLLNLICTVAEAPVRFAAILQAGT